MGFLSPWFLGGMLALGIPFYLHLSVIMAVADYFTNDQLQRIGYAGLLAIEWAVTLPVSAAFVAILFWRAQETN